MDIRAATQLPASATTVDRAAPQTTSGAQLSQDVERAKRASAPRELADSIAPAPEIELPDLPYVRAELSVDKAARRVHTRLVDSSDGTVIREYPTEEQLRYLRVTREQIGKLLKAEA